jgi:sugar lactone lactonase YvrE
MHKRLRQRWWLSLGLLLVTSAVAGTALAVSNAFTISTLAGTGKPGFSGDGGPAASASINQPAGMAFDSKGNLYFVDYVNYRVRKITPRGIITTVAGNGRTPAPNEEDKVGRATRLPLNTPRDVAVDRRGNIYIVAHNRNRIRKVTPDGIIRTFAGTGFGLTSSGDGGPATKAHLASPEGLTVDASGNVYVTEYHTHRVRRITPRGIITTVAGNGKAGFSGDGGPARRAQLYRPFDVAVDAQGNLYISDFGNYRVRKVTPGGIISTIAGNGQFGLSDRDGTATSLPIGSPVGIAVAGQTVYLAVGIVVREITGSTITTIAGTLKRDIRRPCCFLGDGGPALLAELQGPQGVAVDRAGNVYFGDTMSNRIRKLTK